MSANTDAHQTPLTNNTILKICHHRPTPPTPGRNPLPFPDVTQFSPLLLGPSLRLSPPPPPPTDKTQTQTQLLTHGRYLNRVEAGHHQVKVGVPGGRLVLDLAVVRGYLHTRHALHHKARRALGLPVVDKRSGRREVAGKAGVEGLGASATLTASLAQTRSSTTSAATPTSCRQHPQQEL